MRNRTLIYAVAGILVIGAQAAALWVIATRPGSDTPQPPVLPTPAPLPTPPPLPVSTGPWIRPVETDYACLYFNNMRVDMRQGTITFIEQPPVSPYEWMSGRASSPNGQYEVVQNEQQLFIESASREPELLAGDLSMRVWNNLNWSPDNRYVMIEEDNRMRIFEISSLEMVLEVPLVEPSGGLIFYGWSPDSAYFAFTDYQGLRIWSAAEGRVLDVPRPPDSILSIHFAWSPNTHTLAYVWMATDNQHAYVSLYTPGQEHQPRFPLSETWIDRMDWSPDGRWLAVQQASDQDYEHTLVHVFGADGTAYPDILRLRRAFDPRGWLISDDLIWQIDSSALMWYEETWEVGEIYEYRLMEYALDTQAVTEHAAKMPNPPVYSPNNRYVSQTTRLETGRKVELLDTLDWTKFGLVEGADDTGNVTWSPDGRYAAVVWARGVDGGREVFLTWAQADGSNRHLLADAFWNVRDVRWLADDQLAFIAQRREGYSVEIADLKTGDTRVLAAGLDEIGELNHEGGLLQFLWQVESRAGLSAYQPDGKPAYRLVLPVEYSRHDLWSAFFSPDQRYAALKIRHPNGESLYLASADGSWGQEVRSRLYGLGDPLWSPDSKHLAFTQAVAWTQASLEVVTAQGEDVWRTPGYEGSYLNLTWESCA